MRKTNRQLAEECYDAGPRFEWMNEINRPAWVSKIKKLLDAKDRYWRQRNRRK